MQQQQQRQSKRALPWGRLTVGCMVTLLLSLAGLTLFLSAGHIIDGIWSYILPIVLTIAAILVPFWQALFPPSSNPPTPDPKQIIPPPSPPTPSPLPQTPPVGTLTTPPQPPIPPVGTPTPQVQSQSSGTPVILPIPTTPVAQSQPLPTIFYFNTPHLPNVDELYGRRRECITLLDRTRKGGCTSIVGPRRIGKTWLMDYLKLAAPAQLDSTFHFATLDGTMPQCQTIAEFCARVLDGFGVPFATSQADMDMLGRFVREQRARTIHPVLCIDEFEGFFNRQTFDHEFLANLRYLAMNDGLALVISSRSPLIDLLDSHSKTSPFFNIFHQLSLKPFNLSEAVRCLPRRRVTRQGGMMKSGRLYSPMGRRRKVNKIGRRCGYNW